MKISTIIAILMLLASAGLLVAGTVSTHKVYEEGEDEFGLQTFYRISDRALIEDATFSGVQRIKGKLTTMYDRSAPKAKRACPT